MNERLILSWNARVRNNDTVYIVGDMFFRCEEVESILQKLKGKKHLVLGNHDSWAKRVDCSRYFVGVDKYLETSDGLHALTLCHYPLVTWKHSRRSYMIHGHIHNDRSSDYWPLLQNRTHVLNAGVDINGYMPVTFEELVRNNELYKNRDVRLSEAANENE